ncbi:uncharacterized membrane protein YkvA (DUF1232 family) [Hymenobacter sp. 9A]|uniref:Uncharacterized membrane protein YkvA (DUF1232 family) n=1 Tax=Hymenobacter caeli TaxID=2735894 RepID=A0ABX2FN88_9BACT|nr:uncharacterized membrane protein YkvA (DUF1232 family) [Hymenobacter caeli]
MNTQTPPSGADVAGSALFKKFLAKAENYLRQPTLLRKLLLDAYTKAQQKNELGSLAHEAWTTLQTLFRLIRASVAGDYTGVPGTTVAAAVAVLIYFISPIDLIPDFIPVVGLVDDMALIAWFSLTIKTEIDKFHEWELTRPSEVAAAPKPAPAAHDDLVPSSGSAKYGGTVTAPHAGVAAATTDSSRDASHGTVATGGNVR